MTVVWVAHLTSTVSLSADAVAIVEHDFDQVARELRAAAAKQLGDSQVPWDFQWRQGPSESRSARGGVPRERGRR